MKKDAYYFSHDANAQDDPKCMVLIDQLGMEGYGIFWALIEKLRSEKDYRLPLVVVNSFAKRWGTSREKIEIVIKSFGLFVVDSDNTFFSLRLLNSMTLKSETAKNNALKRWGKNAIEMQRHSNGIAEAMQNDAIKVKESKVKESKESKIIYTPSLSITALVEDSKNKAFEKPTIQAVKEYFKENGYSEKSAETAWHYYDSANWVDSQGKKVRNWKQKMRGVWFKQENKNKGTNSGMVW